MKTELYSLLNADAKAWWYHRDLRKAGNVTEARKRERQSIKSKLETLRGAWFFNVGRGGWSIHYNHKNPSYSNCTLQGYGGIDAPLIQACIALGLPGYDVTDKALDNIGACMRAPMVSQTPDKPKEDGTYGGMSYAPVDYVLRYYRDNVAATVYNMPEQAKD